MCYLALRANYVSNLDLESEMKHMAKETDGLLDLFLLEKRGFEEGW